MSGSARPRSTSSRRSRCTSSGRSRTRCPTPPPGEARRDHVGSARGGRGIGADRGARHALRPPPFTRTRQGGLQRCPHHRATMIECATCRGARLFDVHRGSFSRRRVSEAKREHGADHSLDAVPYRALYQGIQRLREFRPTRPQLARDARSGARRCPLQRGGRAARRRRWPRAAPSASSAAPCARPPRPPWPPRTPRR